MDRRFTSVFDALAERRTRGESFRSVLASSTNEELIGALAAAGQLDLVAANAIATELLNRTRRAPFGGAFFVGLVIVVAVYVLDYVYTGTFLILDSGPRAYILIGISTGIVISSFLMYFLWRGRLPRTQSRLGASRRY